MGMKSKKEEVAKEPWAPQADILEYLLPKSGEWFFDPNTQPYQGIFPAMEKAWGNRAYAATNIIPEMAAKMQGNIDYFTQGKAFDDPTLSPAIDAATRGTNRQYGEQVMPQIRGQYAGSGAGYGGSRMARDQTLATSELSNKVGQTAGDMTTQNFVNALRGATTATQQIPDVAKMHMVGGTILDDIAKQEAGFNTDPQLAKIKMWSDLINMKDYGQTMQSYQQQSGGQGAAAMQALMAAYAMYSMASALCWVADAIYGEGSEEAAMARLWISTGWKGRIADVTRTIYKKIGPTVAGVVKKSSVLKAILKPLFNQAVKRGRNYAKVNYADSNSIR